MFGLKYPEATMQLFIFDLTLLTSIRCLASKFPPRCLDYEALTMTDAYLNDPSHNSESAASVLECASKCAESGGCRSFGFELESSSCHLQTKNSSSLALVGKRNWIYSDIENWPKEMFGPCGVKRCSLEEECHYNRALKIALCIRVSCSDPVHLPNAHVTNGSTIIGSVRKYSCRHGYLDTSRQSREVKVKCLDNMTWSEAALKCSGPFILVATPRVSTDTYRHVSSDTVRKLIGATSSLVFLVRTCHDANLELRPSKSSQIRNVIRVVIGGNKNSETWIWEIGSKEKTYRVSSPQVLNCNQFRPFWLAWSNRIVTLGQSVDVKKNVLVKQLMFERLDGVGLALSTYIDNPGTWLFLAQGGGD